MYKFKLKDYPKKDLYAVKLYSEYDDDFYDDLKCLRNFNTKVNYDVIDEYIKVIKQNFLLENIDYVTYVSYNDEIGFVNELIAEEICNRFGLNLIDNFFVPDYKEPDSDEDEDDEEHNDKSYLVDEKTYLSEQITSTIESYTYLDDIEFGTNIHNILIIDYYCSTGNVISELIHKNNNDIKFNFLVYELNRNCTSTYGTEIKEYEEIEDTFTNNIHNGYVVKINSLFDRENFTIDFRYDTSIIIGENGYGKSSALRLATLALDDTFSSRLEMLSYYFDSIEIDLMNTSNFIESSRIIKYEELLPTKQSLLNLLTNNEELDMFSCLFKNKSQRRNLLSNIIYCLQNISNEEYYKLYKNINVKNILDTNSFLNDGKISLYDCDFSLLESIINNIIKEDNLRKFIITNKVIYFDTTFSKNYIDHVNEFFYLPIDDNEPKKTKYPDYDATHLVSMPFIKGPLVDYDEDYYPATRNAFYTQMFNMYTNLFFNKKPNNDQNDEFKSELLKSLYNSNFTQSFKFVNSKNYSINGDNIDQFTRSKLYFNNDELYNLLQLTFNKKKKDSNNIATFDLDKIISFLNRDYYTHDNRLKLNEKIVSIINNSIQDFPFDNISDTDYNNYIHWYDYYFAIMKIITSDTSTKISENMKNKFFNKIVYFIEINKLIESDHSLINPKVIEIQKYINKYLNGKKIRLYSKNAIFIDSFTNNYISPNFLSTGEKNIVYLFLLAAVMNQSVHYNNYTLVLDEPDISMNLSWQETLIEDLKKVLGDKIRLVIATQSPLLVQNPALYNTIHDLDEDIRDLEYEQLNKHKNLNYKKLNEDFYLKGNTVFNKPLTDN